MNFLLLFSFLSWTAYLVICAISLFCQFTWDGFQFKDGLGSPNTDTMMFGVEMGHITSGVFISSKIPLAAMVDTYAFNSWLSAFMIGALAVSRSQIGEYTFGCFYYTICIHPKLF